VVLTLVFVTTGHAAAAPRKATPADQALASAAALRLSDFPPGWRAGPGPKPASYTKYGTVCSQLGGVQRAAITRNGSSDFNQNNETVSNAASVYTTPAAVAAILRLLQTSRTQACLKKITEAGITRVSTQGVTVTSTSFGRLSVAPLGDLSVGYELVLGVAKSGLNVNAYVDVIYTQVGRVAIGFLSSNVGTSPSAGVAAEFSAAAIRAAMLQGGLSSTTPLTSNSQ
jgi:hypothetical protein